jgi:hypothetical protein
VATALNIIERALRSIGVLAQGETATAETANDALTSLNDLLAGIANEGLLAYQEVYDTLTLDGSTSYTFGLSGTPDISSVRPIRVRSVSHTVNGIEYPVDIITANEYGDIGIKTQTGDILKSVFINTTYPNATIYVYPVAPSGTLNIASEKAITAFAGLTTTVSLPPGYERMLRYALAVELMPEYGVQNPQVFQMAIDSKADLKRTNFKPMVLKTNLPFGAGYGAGRILSDGE